MKLVKGLSVLSAAIILAACGGGDDTKTVEKEVLVNAEDRGLTGNTSTYAFANDAGASTVSYTGQGTRHLLINELKAYIASDEFLMSADKATALASLNFIYETGTISGGNDLTNKNVYTDASEATPVGTSVKTEGASLTQADFSDLSGGKALKEKMAGQDQPLTNGEFFGWTLATPAPVGDDAVKGQGVNATPHLLVQEWFDAVATLAGDNDSDTTYVSATGLDYQQLIQKFLSGAVAYSQASEDYLSLTRVADGKGLFASNLTESGQAYTDLEHAWDEGFGYFGAARDYLAYTDANMAGQADHDTNEDGQIDFYSEFSFGNSINAVKRDKGATDATYFSENAMTAFIQGRQIIQDNIGTDAVLNDGYYVALARQATIALNNWESSIAATVVHYINDTLGDMDKFGTEDYSLATHAKHWGEMKGFMLGLQFAPEDVAQMSIADQKAVQTRFGEAPVLADGSQGGVAAGDAAAAIAAYKVALKEARTMFQESYGFTKANVENW